MRKAVMSHWKEDRHNEEWFISGIYDFIVLVWINIGNCVESYQTILCNNKFYSII